MRFGAIVFLASIPSSSNLREHWAVKAHRAKLHRTAGKTIGIDILSRGRIARPAKTDHYTVTLTRMSPRLLDDDNLRGALKSVRDGVADALGIDDRDQRVEWHYKQEKSKQIGVFVLIDDGKEVKA